MSPRAEPDRNRQKIYNPNPVVRPLTDPGDWQCASLNTHQVFLPLSHVSNRYTQQSLDMWGKKTNVPAVRMDDWGFVAL